ncbi:hypothetical protein CAPTEDRAFT_195832 [Capitella teleta]|uniref:Uncharacterized protein n=1 Tax=Capitella teleta TaxID=283909 RepID=R7UIT0_CAPTE|nr:hypothetical protein CAPTEDRAFT_195832 [Capitella teleta]|eukprot:ELU03708.1 hypothetical protein CAPTEDRAFT_195832 [Capitella teleta]
MLQFHLLIGASLMEVSTMRDIHSPQIISALAQNSLRKPFFPASNIQSTFGLGWNLGAYRGFTFSGQQSELTSKVTVFVEFGLALFTSVNTQTNEGTPYNDVIHYYIADVMLGISPWINNNMACSHLAPWLTRIPEPETPGDRFKERLVSIQDHEADRQRDLRRQFEQRLLPTQHFKYTGHFRQGFFGSISIYYASGEERLFAAVGDRGLGYLHAITEEI